MKRSLQKAVFLLKLSGAFDLIVKHAFAHGFANGHKFGKHFGNLESQDIEDAYVDYKKVLEEDMSGKEE